MSMKKKLGLGIATAALGISLVGGGTFAYFSDTAETTSTFAAGTLDLSANPTTIIDVNKIKPGDWMTRSFELKNNGSLDIAKVLLETSYEVTDAKGDNAGEDFGKHIRVNFLWNEDKAFLGPWSPDDIVFNTTLADLQSMSPDAVANEVFVPILEERGGLKSGDSDKLYVQFQFVENDQDQNKFQGDSLKLKWTFEGKQGSGQAK
ncbi:Spore coat-associated protein N precursor [Oceanobacillus picturae]|uniref:Spore coat-associated protein N n=1 Tax=Oceanobacillus picturae TaxID=171693 RepID=W9AK40_9BACI|nr:CalY family protein [Oceanobacillus picturae]CDO03282.1 Spore coat-associated protein N precursor [Oceanobacillus picturae]